MYRKKKKQNTEEKKKEGVKNTPEMFEEVINYNFIVRIERFEEQL